MGMNTKAMKAELAAMDSRMITVKKADGEMMDNLLSLKVEKIEEPTQKQEQDTPRLKRARLAVVVTRPILSIGVELFSIVYTVTVYAVTAIAAVLLADVMMRFALDTAHIAPESTYGVCTGIACYGAAIWAYVKETPRLVREGREWLFEPFRRALKNNPAQAQEV